MRTELVIGDGLLRSVYVKHSLWMNAVLSGTWAEATLRLMNSAILLLDDTERHAVVEKGSTHTRTWIRVDCIEMPQSMAMVKLKTESPCTLTIS